MQLRIKSLSKVLPYLPAIDLYSEAASFNVLKRLHPAVRSVLDHRERYLKPYRYMNLFLDKMMNGVYRQVLQLKLFLFVTRLRKKQQKDVGVNAITVPSFPLSVI